MEKIDYILGFLYYFSLSVPLIVGLFFIRAIPPKMKVFFILIVLAFVNETAALIMTMNRVNNYLLYQAYFFLEFFMWAVLFLQWYQSPLIRRGIIAGFIGFGAFWLYINLFVGSDSNLSNLALILESLFLLMLSGYTLLALFYNTKSDIRHDYRFWIIAGLMLNFAGNSFIYSSLRFIINQAQTLWRIHWIINSIVNVFYAMGFMSLDWEKSFGLINAARSKKIIWDVPD